MNGHSCYSLSFYDMDFGKDVVGIVIGHHVCFLGPSYICDCAVFYLYVYIVFTCFPASVYIHLYICF